MDTPQIKSKILNAQVSASPYDERYEMALVYCMDRAANYCFSLTRFPDQDEIEVMVLDQVLTKVTDLELTLDGDVLTANLDPVTAGLLDGIQKYVINLEVSDDERRQLLEALKKIFEGKKGFKLALP